MTGYIPSASLTFQCCSSTTSTKSPNRPRNCQSTSVLRIVLHIVFRRHLTADHSTSNATKSGKWTDECKWIWLEDYDDRSHSDLIRLAIERPLSTGHSLTKYREMTAWRENAYTNSMQAEGRIDYSRRSSQAQVDVLTFPNSHYSRCS
jgi:hypothetical protein